MFDKMKLCPQHKKKIPLIWTFKFAHKEYWCPYCGFTQGMFGIAPSVEETPDLKIIHDGYSNKAKDFLSGKTDKWDYESEQ